MVADFGGVYLVGMRRRVVVESQCDPGQSLGALGILEEGSEGKHINPHFTHSPASLQINTWTA